MYRTDTRVFRCAKCLENETISTMESAVIVDGVVRWSPDIGPLWHPIGWRAIVEHVLRFEHVDCADERKRDK